MNVMRSTRLRHWSALTLTLVVAMLARATSNEAVANPAKPPEKASGPRTEMVIIGSTLMAPFTQAMVDHLVTNADLLPARILQTGTAAGVKAFCEGVGLETPDVAAVSRRMRVFEYEQCLKNGVTDIIEILIGYEAVVVTQRIGDADLALTSNTLYRALAAELPQSEEFLPNPNRMWSDIDPDLPKSDIHALLPASTLGARSFFDDRILQGACRSIPDIKSIFEANERVRQCITLRRDGRIDELGVPFVDNLRKAIKKAPPGTVAVMSLRHASELSDLVKIASVNGVVASRQTIGSREYEFVRPLYYYIKKAHVKDYAGEGLVKGLRELITEMTRDATIGPNGYLVPLGVVPMPDDKRLAVRDSSLRLARFVR